MSTYAMISPTATANFAQYVSYANRAPYLKAEEEHDLAVRLYEDDDIEAARLLVFSHLRYVVQIARGYSGYGLPVEDLVQEGNVGLMKAVKRFDPYHGVRLVSFAVYWIKAEIHEYILRNWSIVKIATTKAQRKLFFNLRKFKKSLEWMKINEVKELAANLDVSEKNVLEMEARLGSHDTPFDGFGDDSDDETFYAPAQYVASEIDSPDQIAENDELAVNLSSELAEALSKLDERSLEIIQSRWLADSKTGLKELGEKYGVSAERIRQLEKQAMAIIRKEISQPA